MQTELPSSYSGLRFSNVETSFVFVLRDTDLWTVAIRATFECDAAIETFWSSASWLDSVRFAKPYLQLEQKTCLRSAI